MGDLKRGLAPTHPGLLLKAEILPHLGKSMVEIAEALGISRKMLYKLTTGESGVSAEMALRLAKLLGTRPEFWLNLQAAYDLWQVRPAIADEIERIPQLRAPEA